VPKVSRRSSRCRGRGGKDERLEHCRARLDIVEVKDYVLFEVSEPFDEIGGLVTLSFRKLEKTEGEALVGFEFNKTLFG